MRSSLRWRSARSWLGAATAVAALACSSDKSSGPKATGIASVISGLSLEGNSAVTAVAHTGTAPAASGGPTASVSVGSAAVVGGSTIVTVSSANAFTRVLVRLQDNTGGYYELTLPSATTSANLVLSVAQGASAANGVHSAIAVGTATTVGAYSDADVTLISAGQGDVQVSVSWDSDTDVDLHLVQPGTHPEIYYGNLTDPTTGAELDVDSNPDCSIDHRNNENVTYGSHTPPRGTYIVRLDYYNGCSQAATHYVVTVRVKGQPTKTFTGTFTGGGDRGDVGSGTTIYTFTY